jgi:hypothetical protein
VWSKCSCLLPGPPLALPVVFIVVSACSTVSKRDIASRVLQLVAGSSQYFISTVHLIGTGLRRPALSKHTQYVDTILPQCVNTPVRLCAVQLIFAVTAAATSACCSCTIAVKTAASATRDFYIIVL